MTDYNVQTRENYEPRNCFKTSKHGDHLHSVNTFGIPGKPAVSMYWCDGNQPRPEPELWNQSDVAKAEAFAQLSSEASVDETDPAQRLGKQAELLASRRAVYGDTVSNMEYTAMIWSGIAHAKIEPYMVPLMFAAYKLFRASVTPDYSDNIDDAEGYEGMFREVVEKTFSHGMVQARTVDEYLNIKADGTKERVVEIRIPEESDEPVDMSDPVDRLPAVLGRDRLNLIQSQYAAKPRHPYEVADRQAADEEQADAHVD